MPDTDTTLPAEKRYHGFTYRRVEYRPAVGYIYAQERNGRVVAYEVFRAKYTPCRSRSRPDGTTYTVGGMDQWPHSEAFGKWAWSFRTLEKAQARLAELTDAGAAEAA